MTAKIAKAPTKKAKTTKPKPPVISAAKTTEKKTVEKMSGKYNQRAWNTRLGLVLVAEAVAVVVAGSSKTAELTVQYLAKDTLATEAAGSGSTVLATATRHLVDVRLSWIVAGFLLVFAATLLLAATVWRKQYEAGLQNGVNKLRWIGLGVGGGAIFTTVAMLSGVSDVSTLTLMFGSALLASLLASVIEFVDPGRGIRRLLAVGSILALFLPWLVFVRSSASVVMFGGSLPVYLYYLYASGTLLLVALGLGLYFRVKKRGKWADALYTEKMFMCLSFAAATLLALQIFAGALQP